jgi:hypothetical protein
MTARLTGEAEAGPPSSKEFLSRNAIWKRNNKDSFGLSELRLPCKCDDGIGPSGDQTLAGNQIWVCMYEMEHGHHGKLRVASQTMPLGVTPPG